MLRAPMFLPPFLFETQWLYWTAAIALAVILLHLGRSRADKTSLRIGLGVAAAAVLWIVLALVLVTPGERLRKAHNTLAQAATNNDVNTILSYLSPTFRCTALGITVGVEAKDQLPTILQTAGIRKNHITAYSSESAGNTATTRLTVFTESSNGTVKTSWQLLWNDLPGDDWKIDTADLLKINDQDASRLPSLMKGAY